MNTTTKPHHSSCAFHLVIWIFNKSKRAAMSAPLTQEQKLEIYSLWNEGLSATLIGVKFGKTRNAIVGLVHRARERQPELILRSIENTKPHAKAPTSGRQKMVPGKPLPVQVIAVDEPKPLGNEAEHLASGCQFIIGDTNKPDWRMCGCPVHKRGSSWCEYHYVNKVRNPIQPKRKGYSFARTTRSHQADRRGDLLPSG